MKYNLLRNTYIVFVVFCFFTQEAFSQKGKFELSVMNLNHPITTFDRENTFLVIRNMILNDSNEFVHYKKIKNISNYYSGSEAYNSVNNTYSLEELQSMRQTCTFHARSQAFVALIGIDENNSFGNMDTIRKDFNFEKLLLNY